jgi:hypothetical protein
MASTPKSYPWQRRRRRLLWILLVFLIFPLSIGCIVYLHNAWHLQDQLAAIRAAGFPVTPQELAQWPAQTPAVATAAAPQASAQNAETTATGTAAVEGYQDAFKLMKKGTPENAKLGDLSKGLQDTPKQGRLPDALYKQMAECLATHAEALRILHENVQKPAGRFPLDWSKGYALDLSHVQSLFDAAKLFQMEALVAAQDHNPDRALESILAGIAIDAPLRFEPLLCSQLASVTCHGMVCDTLSRALGMISFSDAQLAQMKTRILELENPEALRRALAGERVLALHGYANPPDDINALPELKEKLRGLDNLIPGTSALLAPAGKQLMFNTADQNRYLSVMNEMISVSHRPSAEIMPAMKSIEYALEKKTWLPRLSSLNLSAIIQCVNSFTRDQAQLRCASAALAIERYRLVARQIPNSLDALVPAFLSAVPQDPFDGKPIRYRPEAKGYLIYSISGNLQDDQGTVPKKDSKWFTNGDWVFQVAR